MKSWYAPVPADAEERAAYIRGAADLASTCSAVVLVLGGSSSRFRNMIFEDNGAVRTAEDNGRTLNLTDCGEGVDTADIALPGWQRELLAAVRDALGEKPLVVVLNAGRPYASDSFAPLADAVLCSFYGGPSAGTAAAEILFGDVNPSGRLSASFPRTTGEIPAAYNRRCSYDPRYADLRGEPDYPFGFGLSYTKFGFGDAVLRAGDRTLPLPADGSPNGRDRRRPAFPFPVLTVDEAQTTGLTLSFRVKNEGAREGVAVPMLFLRHSRGSVIPRLSELKDFIRIPLEPGEEKEAVLRLTPEGLAHLTRDMKTAIEPGVIELSLKEGGAVRWRGAVKIE